RSLHIDNYPEFNGTAAPPRTPMTVIRELGDRVVGMFKPPAAVAPAPAAPSVPDEASLIDAFLARADVVQVPDSRLVDVTFQSIDKSFAAVAVNTLMKEYVDQNLVVKIASTQNTLEWLQGELAKQEKKVEQNERDLAMYRERQNAMSLDEKQNVVQTHYMSLSDQLNKARQTKAQKQALWEQVRSLASSGNAPEVIATVA